MRITTTNKWLSLRKNFIRCLVLSKRERTVLGSEYCFSLEASITLTDHFHSMFEHQVRTCSRSGVRMVCCITAWILFQRFLGNRKLPTRQIMSWKLCTLSPRPLTCRKSTCTKMSRTAPVSLSAPVTLRLRLSAPFANDVCYPIRFQG